MLSYSSAIIDEIIYKNLSVREIPHIIKLNLRGKKNEFFTNVEKSLNITLPTKPNTSSANDMFTSIWLSPDEWMIVSNEIEEKDSIKYELEKLLFNNISKTNLGSVTDVTDQLVLLELKGQKIYELFASGSPFNFNEFKEKKRSYNSNTFKSYRCNSA